MSSWWPLLELPCWCPIFEWSHCNSLEGQPPVDFIHGYPIFLNTWGKNKIAAVSRKAFSKYISCWRIAVFWLKFYWILFDQLIASHHWFRNIFPSLKKKKSFLGFGLGIPDTVSSQSIILLDIGLSSHKPCLHTRPFEGFPSILEDSCRSWVPIGTRPLNQLIRKCPGAEGLVNFY